MKKMLFIVLLVAVSGVNAMDKSRIRNEQLEMLYNQAKDQFVTKVKKLLTKMGQEEKEELQGLLEELLEKGEQGSLFAPDSHESICKLSEYFYSIIVNYHDFPGICRFNLGICERIKVILECLE